MPDDLRPILLRAARQQHRWWLYRKGGWDGHGISIGSDEYGRRTIALRLPGHRAVIFAHWTCTCEDCHGVREQTYRWACEMADIGGYEEYAQRVRRAWWAYCHSPCLHGIKASAHCAECAVVAEIMGPARVPCDRCGVRPPEWGEDRCSVCAGLAEAIPRASDTPHP